MVINRCIDQFSIKSMLQHLTTLGEKYANYITKYMPVNVTVQIVKCLHMINIFYLIISQYYERDAILEKSNSQTGRSVKTPD